MLGFLASCIAPGLSAAQGAPDKENSRAWARANEIDKLTAKRLKKVREHLSNEEYAEANATLDRFRLRSLNAAEKERVYSFRGFVAHGLEDFTVARESFELAIAQGVLDAKVVQEYRFQIAQLCMQQSEWHDAVKNFELWFENEEEPNSVGYYLLALSYWQIDDLDGALAPAIEAVEIADEPQEAWLQLLLAVRLTRKEYAETIPIFDVLLRKYPKKAYWVQLSTLHGALGNYEESLVPLQLAYTQGLLDTDEEIRKLAQLLLFLELPIRAVDVMTDGLSKELVEEDSDFYEMLSNSFIMAREYDKAVDPLTKAAALAEGGHAYLRLAEVHIQRERWGEAREALSLAIDKGDLPEPGQAELLMGIAFYSQKENSKALKWFSKASNFDSTKAEASTWLNHIEREIASNAENTDA
ncbi:MAG: tetratricopeptide (TPR) repeat protein [Myxococcota bacterium]